MIASMADDDLPARRPGDSDTHRRQRTKNRLMLAFLMAIVVIFFALTLVRLRGTWPS
jgi:hypothetical protein